MRSLSRALKRSSIWRTGDSPNETRVSTRNSPPFSAALAGSTETNNNPISWANFFSQSVGKAGRLGAYAQIGATDAPMLQQFPYQAAQSGRRHGD